MQSESTRAENSFLASACGRIKGGRDDGDENSVVLNCAKVSCMSLKEAKRGE